MPTPGLSYSCGPARIDYAAVGQLTAVTHRQDRPLSYLSGGWVSGVRLNGDLLPDVAPEVVADTDELEVTTTYPGQLRVGVRHSFAAGWSTRITVANLSATPAEVDGVELNLQPGRGCVAWALALGVTSAYAIAPTSGGPLLGGLLRLGSLRRVTASGLELSAFSLRPGGRHVVALHWDWYRTPRAFDQERYGQAPSALFSWTGEPVVVRVDEDVAAVTPDAVQTSRDGDRLELMSPLPGRYACELRSARGTTAFELSWTDSVEDVLVAAAGETLRGPRTAAGVVKLAGVAEALVVQCGLALNRLDEPEEAAEALDLVTARLLAAAHLEPLAAAYLSREFDRLGDPDLLTAATDTVLAQRWPAPGLGIAATQACLGLIVSGREVAPLLHHLSQLDASTSSQAGPGGDEAATLELVAVTDAGPGAAGGLKPFADQRQRIAGLGLHLGAGLKGRAVAPLPTDDLSHLITVFQLLPDGLSSSMSRLWGCSATTLARRATPELLARLEGEPVGAAHAWLVLALHTR